MITQDINANLRTSLHILQEGEGGAGVGDFHAVDALDDVTIFQPDPLNETIRLNRGQAKPLGDSALGSVRDGADLREQVTQMTDGLVDFTPVDVKRVWRDLPYAIGAVWRRSGDRCHR